jgi:hypothetical protein|tara:strand:+ start:1083 stop:1232 length:150 start_codon:yes stop_codon:yes gene_type:complete
MIIIAKTATLFYLASIFTLIFDFCAVILADSLMLKAIKTSNEPVIFLEI